MVKLRQQTELLLKENSHASKVIWLATTWLRGYCKMKFGGYKTPTSAHTLVAKKK